MIVLGRPDEVMKIMNRISDYLFVLARYIGYKNGEAEETWHKE
jgi:cob(I)alamin adenosyltransferase